MRQRKTGRWISLPLLFCPLCIVFSVLGCEQNAKSRAFGIAIANFSGGEISPISVSLTGGATWPFGVVSINGEKVVDGIPGTAPASADVTWTDAVNIGHKQHVNISPPSSASDYRVVFFQIQPNGSVTVSVHAP
jgi:hypothetical protein